MVEFCFNGECLAQVCTPGQDFCDQNSVVNCSDDGLSFQIVEDCGESNFCNQAATSAACQPKVCEPNSIFCDGNTVKACDSIGSAATLVEDCGTQGKGCAGGECSDSPLGTNINPADSCFQLLQTVPEVPSGLYWIHPLPHTLDTYPQELYCDMETDGGGWTLAIVETPYQIDSPAEFAGVCANAGFADAGRGMDLAVSWLVTKRYLWDGSHPLSMSWPDGQPSLAMPMWKTEEGLRTINENLPVSLPANITGDHCSPAATWEPICGYWHAIGWNQDDFNTPDPEDWPVDKVATYLNCSFR